ncbi:hypothetical protein MIND_00677400 [Mycena indigotica]|uniref:Uncharacterized protein n=1 Tax=Mycena indigotica TaxID=2126181 RepID=A0A8H6SK11_9AGAR|nr:uncharacterized protein MIND_00677400 [Mycena indigotica]KAF7301130.1 hypothetical protein MIND_00677400 [Mycena indigotica]
MNIIAKTLPIHFEFDSQFKSNVDNFCNLKELHKMSYLNDHFRLSNWRDLLNIRLPQIPERPNVKEAYSASLFTAPTPPVPTHFRRNAHLEEDLFRRLDRFISINNLGEFSEFVQTTYTFLLQDLPGPSTMPDTSHGVSIAALEITRFICTLWRDIHPEFSFNGFYFPRGVSGANLDLTLKADHIAISGFSAVFLPPGVLQEAVIKEVNGMHQVDPQTQNALEQLGTKIELLQHIVSEPVYPLKFRADLDIRFGLLFAYPFFCIVEDTHRDALGYRALLLSDVTSCAPSSPPERHHLASLIALWFALSIPEQDVHHADGRITLGVELHPRVTPNLNPSDQSPAEPSNSTSATPNLKVLDRIHVRWTGSSSLSLPIADMRLISRQQLEMLSTDSDGSDDDEDDEEDYDDYNSDDYSDEMDDVETPPSSDNFDGLSNFSGCSSRSPTPVSPEIAGDPVQLTITGITGSDDAQLYHAVLDMGGTNQRSILLKAIARTRASDLADELATYERLDARTSADKSPSLVPQCWGAFEDPRCAWVGAILEHSESCPPFDSLSPNEKNGVYNALRRLHSLGVQRGSFRDEDVRRSLSANGDWWITSLHGANCEHQCPGEECAELADARKALGL